MIFENLHLTWGDHIQPPFISNVYLNINLLIKLGPGHAIMEGKWDIKLGINTRFWGIFGFFGSSIFLVYNKPINDKKLPPTCTYNINH